MIPAPVHYDVIIIGAGASGLICAIEAGKRGRKVLLVDHEKKVGKKIAISGGGRCNFTNLGVSAENYISNNPHFCKSALKGYSPENFISLIEKNSISWHEEDHGQLFCDSSAKDIVDLLLNESRRARVNISRECDISELTKKENFEIKTNIGGFSSDSLVIATGGLSYSKIGATGFGYDIAKQFGMKTVDRKPGLVPINLKDNEWKNLKSLAGITIKAEVSLGKIRFNENILFTHKGISGPSILQISSYWNKGDKITINVLPDLDLNYYLIEQKSINPKMFVKNILSRLLPKRFVEVALNEKRPIGEISNKDIQAIASKFNGWKTVPKNCAGYDSAEVTVGGIDTSELSSKTMESKKVEGLYFTGEVIDVTGQLGGYNLQWAWASGFAAGQYV